MTTALLAAVDLTQLGTLLSSLAVPIGAVGALLLAVDRRKSKRLRSQDRQLTGWEGWEEDVLAYREWSDTDRSNLIDQVRELAAQVRELGGTPIDGGRPRTTTRPRFPKRIRGDDEPDREPE